MPHGHQVIAASPVRTPVGGHVVYGSHRCLYHLSRRGGQLYSSVLIAHTIDSRASPDTVRIDSEWVLPGRTGDASDVAFRGSHSSPSHCAKTCESRQDSLGWLYHWLTRRVYDGLVRKGTGEYEHTLTRRDSQLRRCSVWRRKIKSKCMEIGILILSVTALLGWNSHPCSSIGISSEAQTS